MILVKTDCIPFTSVAKVLVVVLKVFELIRVVVATTPLVTLVKTLAAELKVLVVEEAKIALMLPIMALEIVVVPSKDKLVKPLILVVEVIPLTVLVIKFVVDEKESVLVVVAAIKLAKLVVAITPLILVVITPVEVAKVTELLEITLLVATTPFTVVVKVLPESD
jgi:hypothetical protein